MSAPFASLSRASTIHSEDHTEGPSFAVETPTPASRSASRTPSGIDLAAGEIRTVSDSQKRALAPALRMRKTGQPMAGQLDWSPTTVASTLAPSEPPSSLPVPPVTGKQKITIRSDPALVTCFDPKDKELYDLWTPRA